MNQTYVWKNSEFRKFVDPAVAAEALKEIKTKYGEIKPAHVVDAARKRGHPLHDVFPWDEREAAAVGRESIAARLIRSLKLVVVREDRPAIQVRAFISSHDPTAKGSVSYSEVTETMADPEGRAFILRQAWLTLKAWRRKYADLTELSDIFEAIDGTSLSDIG
jgi:hypothetical protein